MDDHYKGITVNERLYASGLIEEFDSAAYDANIEKVIDIFKKINIMNECEIEPPLDCLIVFMSTLKF